MSTQSLVDEMAGRPPASPLAGLNSPDSVGLDGWSTSIESLNESFATQDEAAGWSVGYSAVCG